MPRLTEVLALGTLDIPELTERDLLFFLKEGILDKAEREELLLRVLVLTFDLSEKVLEEEARPELYIELLEEKELFFLEEKIALEREEEEVYLEG